MIPVLAVLDLSINNLLAALFIIAIVIIFFVAVWKLVAPSMGQFANFFAALIIIVVLVIVAKILGIF